MSIKVSIIYDCNNSWSSLLFLHLLIDWLGWVLVAAREIFLVVHRVPSCGAGGSVVSVHGPGFFPACGIFVPGLELEPVSPALQCRFLSTGPPGKSSQKFYRRWSSLCIVSEFHLCYHLLHVKSKWKCQGLILRLQRDNLGTNVCF